MKFFIADISGLMAKCNNSTCAHEQAYSTLHSRRRQQKTAFQIYRPIHQSFKKWHK